MPDRLKGIEVFVRAMRHGGLSAAGRDLGLSPAMAGKHLDALEQRLGVTLVQRTTRQLSLTEAGRQFLGEADRLLTELAEAEATAAAKALTIEGLIRVNAPVTFGVMHLAPLIPGFSRAHPRVTVELGLNDRYVDLVEEAWDVGVRIGRLSEANLIARKLAPVSSVVCASPDYLIEHGVPAGLNELKDHVCLGYTLSINAGSAKAWRFGANGDVSVPVRGGLWANNGEALVAAAVLGQGLVYGPRFIAASALRAGDLVEVELGVPLYDVGAVYSVSHPDRRPTLKERAWTAHLAEHLSRRTI